jgi:hypothetical protein
MNRLISSAAVVMNRFMLSTTALGALSLLVALPAKAAVFDFTFTQVGTPTNGCCGPFDVSATLVATPSGSNYDIVSIDGTVTQDGTPYAITGLVSPPNDPGDYFNFDNLIISTAGGAPYSLDATGGVAFYAAGITNYYPSDPNAVFNIWGNGGTSGTLGTTASNDVNTSFNGIYSITAATPLPSTSLMLLSGLVGFGFLAYRGMKNRSAALTAA